MGRKPILINPESGKRLSAWLKENGIKQAELAEKINYSQQFLSDVITGKKNMSLELATAISKNTRKRIENEHGELIGYDHIRPQWLLCLDNEGRTVHERLNGILEKAESDAKLLDCIVERIAEDRGYSIHYLSSGDFPNCISSEDGYGIVESDNVVGLVSLDEYTQLRHEIAHYAAYLFEGITKRAKANLHQPFQYKKGENDG